MSFFKKKIYDSVHGFIRFNAFEQKLIDSTVFQRLHYIHQLGCAYFVYPGATHTRFEHSLGAMELASRIFDLLALKGAIPEAPYWKQIVRFAALCHDLGHLPFSHVAEKLILGKEGHELSTLKVIEGHLLTPLWEEVGAQFQKEDVALDVLKMALGEKKLHALKSPVPFTPWEKVLSQILTADFFGADRIDYLLRDAQSTGVSYGLFDYHQLIETLCILPGLELGIEEDGIESCEALLLARYFMHKRVYQYSSVKAYAFHLARFMQKNFLANDLNTTDNDVLSLLARTANDSSLPGHADAICITDREKRFKAIKMPEGMSTKDLLEIKKIHSIPDEEIAWDLSDKPKQSIGLSFPVLRRNQTVVDAKECSDISIPLESASWLFLAPQYQIEL